MLVGLLDVIWTFDGLIRPPGPKMVVCVEPSRGYFYRINEAPKWQVPVFLPRRDNPTFLTKDSYLECGSPIEIDDYIIAQSLEGRGILGKLNQRHVPDICAALGRSARVSPEDRDLIMRALGCPEIAGQQGPA